MKRAIYSRLIGLACVAVLLCSLVSGMIHAVSIEDQTKEWLTKLAYSTAGNYRHDTDAGALSRLAGGIRVTVIGPSGMVVSDSEASPADMESHADREEVRFARQGSVYITVRRSATLSEMFMYASIKTDDGNVLRLACSYSGLLSTLVAQVPAALAAILVSLILSVVLATRSARAVTRPLERMIDALSSQEFEKLSDYEPSYYEIDKVTQTLHELLQTISQADVDLNDEREKVEYILSSMTEGFVLVDSKKDVLLCNSSARAFFSCDEDAELESIYTLTRNQSVTKALQSAIDDGQSTIFDLELQNGLIAGIYISPSKPTEHETGATMLIVDMTAERLLESKKRDFFSNASHELKTPITSIIGFSEMLSNDMVKDEPARSEIIQRIESEAKRMAELIGDILTISRLESESRLIEYTQFDLADVVREAVSAVSPVNDLAAVSVNVDLDDTPCRADRWQMYELCVNLVENAVKYNRPNGRVDVSLRNRGDGIVLTVEDTGVGIPIEHQARVFERFYRVDYGRNRAIGGTGLGLSIVKHIVTSYGGEVSIESRVGDGTRVSVSFPSGVSELLA